MSSRVIRLIGLFAVERTVQAENESQVMFKGTYITPRISAPEAQDLAAALESFPKRDNVSVSIVIADGEATVISSADIDAVKAKLDQLRQRLVIAESGDTFSLELTITKSLKEGAVTLYSPSLFLTHLEKLTFAERLGIFSDFVTQNGTIMLVSDEPVERFGSRTIQFVTDGKPIKLHDHLERKPILAKRDDVAHFANSADYQLVPEDFNLIELGSHNSWQRIFAELTNVLAVAFTADYTTFTKNNELSFKINGYKTLTGSLSSDDLVGPSWNGAFKIYEWTYRGGSISDKAGLLRNVLSLNLDSCGRPRYDEDVYKSVRSGFEIYLKRNVQQYIEIKNKLSDFLRNLSKEALGEVEKYAEALKGTLGALITFFISTMILSAIGGRGLLGIFTTDITYLTYAFLAVFAVYLVLSVVILYRKSKTIKSHYNSLKREYDDILDEGDLKRIFQNDEPLRDIFRELKYQAALITAAWVMITLILGAVAFTLHQKEVLLPRTTNPEIKSTPTPQGPQTP